MYNYDCGLQRVQQLRAALIAGPKGLAAAGRPSAALPDSIRGLPSSLYSLELPGGDSGSAKKSCTAAAASRLHKSSFGPTQSRHGLEHGQRPSRCRRLPGHHSRRSYLLELLGRGRFSQKKMHHTSTPGLPPLVLAATEENAFGTMIHTYHSQGSSQRRPVR